MMKDINQLYEIEDKLYNIETFDDFCDCCGLIMLICQQIEATLALALTEIRPHGNGDFTKKQTIELNVKLRDKFVVERLVHRNSKLLDISRHDTKVLNGYLGIRKYWHHGIFYHISNMSNVDELLDFLDTNYEKHESMVCELLTAEGLSRKILLKAIEVAKDQKNDS